MALPAAPRRIGRPPASENLDTRARLLDVARSKFAELGYQSATNKDIADAAGITTGAIYHHFGSKRDLYTAVFEHVESTVYARYRAVLVPGATVAENFASLLDEAVRIYEDDATIAQFFIEVQTEAMRNEELAVLATQQARSTIKLIAPVVATGHQAGEFHPDIDQRAVVYAMMSIMTGVARFSAGLDDPRVLAEATGVLVRLVSGHLFAPPTGGATGADTGWPRN